MLPIISLAVQYAPWLLGLLVGDNAKAVADTVISTAKQVFGTDDPAEAAAKAQADPNLVNEFVEKLKADTERFKLQIEDTANARQQTIELVHAQSPMAWGAVVISILVTIAFIGNIAVLFTIKVNFTEITGQVLLLLTGTLSAAFTQVINYWLGSSAGSTDKSAQIAALMSANISAPKPKVTGNARR